MSNVEDLTGRLNREAHTGSPASVSASFGKREHEFTHDMWKSFVQEKKNLLKKKVEASKKATSNFMIIFDVESGAARRISGVLKEIGGGFPVTSNVWTFCTNRNVTSIRDAISPHLFPHESACIINVTDGGISWHNLSPELHAKVHAAYSNSKRDRIMK